MAPFRLYVGLLYFIKVGLSIASFLGRMMSMDMAAGGTELTGEVMDVKTNAKTRGFRRLSSRLFLLGGIKASYVHNAHYHQRREKHALNPVLVVCKQLMQHILSHHIFFPAGIYDNARDCVVVFYFIILVSDQIR